MAVYRRLGQNRQCAGIDLFLSSYIHEVILIKPILLTHTCILNFLQT